MPPLMRNAAKPGIHDIPAKVTSETIPASSIIAITRPTDHGNSASAVFTRITSTKSNRSRKVDQGEIELTSSSLRRAVEPSKPKRASSLVSGIRAAALLSMICEAMATEVSAITKMNAKKVMVTTKVTISKAILPEEESRSSDRRPEAQRYVGPSPEIGGTDCSPEPQTAASSLYRLGFEAPTAPGQTNRRVPEARIPPA